MASKVNKKKLALCLVIVFVSSFVLSYFGFKMLRSQNKSGNEKVSLTIRKPTIDSLSPYYTAAVAEIEVLNDGDEHTPLYTKQMVDIIHSSEVREADIVVLSEAVLNRAMANVFMPNSTVFCDDPNAHYTFRNISCAARNAKKYVVMNMYTRIKCADDDQDFCAFKDTFTNAYNMMFVFDRKGAIIAKYRKFNPYNEGVQVTKEPEIVTFQTDFNVTFGIMVCFDIMLDVPGNVFIQRGIRNFVFSTMWHNSLPYGVSVQYQQSWAYGHNVNLVASNANWQATNTTGSGIYAGRLGAQKVFISQIPATKVLVTRLPINLPSEDETLIIKPDEDVKVYVQNDLRITKNEQHHPLYDATMLQDRMELIAVKFLDFSKSTNFSGMVCQGDFCCNYDIEISKNTGANINNGPSYSYGVSLFNDFYQFGEPKYMRTKQIICCVIACAELNDKSTCGKRFLGKVNYPYSIDKLSLEGIVQMDRQSNILPTTLTNDLYPLNVGAFAFKKSKLMHEERYAASMELKTPRSDLLSFGFISRDYQKDTSALGFLTTLQNSDLFPEVNETTSGNNETPSENNETPSENNETDAESDETLLDNDPLMRFIQALIAE